MRKVASLVYETPFAFSQLRHDTNCSCYQFQARFNGKSFHAQYRNFTPRRGFKLNFEVAVVCSSSEESLPQKPCSSLGNNSNDIKPPPQAKNDEERSWKNMSWVRPHGFVLTDLDSPVYSWVYSRGMSGCVRSKSMRQQCYVLCITHMPYMCDRDYHLSNMWSNTV